VALNCLCSGEWGLAFLGFEVKVSRGDLLQELKDPKKRQETYVGVDALFFATPRKLCDPKELPDDVGLIECAVDNGQAWTRIKKRPKDLRLPMEYCETRKNHPEFGWPMIVKDLTVIPPIQREVSAAFIRAFDPSRINSDQVFKVAALQHQNQELRSKLRMAKYEAHQEFREFCYKRGVNAWSMMRDTICP
jgi:hypothetical protein